MMSPRSGTSAGQAALGAGMVAERREIEDAKDDERDDAGIDQQAEHQPLVHHGQDLASLTDKSEPLGPGCDESGSRCVHRAVPESLAVFFELAARRKRRQRIDLGHADRLCHRLRGGLELLIPSFLVARRGLGLGRLRGLRRGRLSRASTPRPSSATADSFAAPASRPPRPLAARPDRARLDRHATGILRLASRISCAAGSGGARAIRSRARPPRAERIGDAARAPRPAPPEPRQSELGSGRPSRASWNPPSRNWSADGADRASTLTFQRSSWARRPRVPISVCSRRMSRWARTIFVLDVLQRRALRGHVAARPGSSRARRRRSSQP